MQMGPKYLIIKKRRTWRFTLSRNHGFFAPALPLEDVFDPTGQVILLPAALLVILQKLKT